MSCAGSYIRPHLLRHGPLFGGPLSLALPVKASNRAEGINSVVETLVGKVVFLFMFLLFICLCMV